jgi:spore coat polysaccharide biosynthesis protein SpsF
MRIVAIIQARMGSSRLPGKVLKTLPFKGQEPVLAQVVRRVRAATLINEVAIATTNSPDDISIVEWARRQEVFTFRGSESNVLERFYLTARQMKADFIVRITADCPCLDPAIVDRVIHDHFDRRADFTSSAIERTFPIGMDLSVFSIALLEEAHKQARAEYELEHVTPYFYRSHPDRFKINVYRAKGSYHRPDLRLTLDTLEDYHFLCAIFDYLYADDPLFPLSEILHLLEQKPWLTELNRGTIQKQVYTSLSEELQDLLDYAEARGMKFVLPLLKK